MKSLLKSTLNTRAILPDSLRFIRSDVPANISNEEIEWLVANNITTVVDLRTEAERKIKKCKLIENPQFKYYCMPISGGDILPNSVDEVSKSYINMIDEQMDKVVSLILTSKSNVLYFCNAGKDRTGVVSALLLLKYGMEFSYIINDYMKSKENLKNLLKAYVEQNPKIDIEVITPKERYIKEFLDWFAG